MMAEGTELRRVEGELLLNTNGAAEGMVLMLIDGVLIGVLELMPTAEGENMVVIVSATDGE